MGYRGEYVHVLMLAYYFPPDSSSGSFRPFFFANHLVGMGVDVTVLTVHEETFLEEQPVNYELLARIDDRVDVVRVGVLRPRESLLALKDAILPRSSKEFSPKGRFGVLSAPVAPTMVQKVKDTVTDLLACPDPHVGWIPGAIRKGLSLIESQDITVIWATGGPWSSLLAARRLRQKSGLPLVIDFRDPWISNPNFVRRGRIAACIERRLERAVLCANEAIIANTEELRDDFIERYGLEPGKVHTITNGFEGYVEGAQEDVKNDRFTIVHAGALYFSRNPRVFLEAILVLLQGGEIGADRLRIQFVGGISMVDPVLTELLENPLLQGVLECIPRVSYAEATAYQVQADLLLLLQPGFPLQVPRKLYEYVASGRPIMAITEERSATANIIRANALGYIVANEVKALGGVIGKMYRRWEEDAPLEVAANPAAPFLNSHLSRQLLGVLRGVQGEGGDEECRS